MKKPTQEQYEMAKNNIEVYSECIAISRRKQTELIDDLSNERDREKSLLVAYEKSREIIVAYEIYEQLQKGEKEK